MKNSKVRAKLSKTRKAQKRWSGEDNPNFGGGNIEKLWQEGKYNQRDYTGSKNNQYIDGRSFDKFYRGPDWRKQKQAALKRDNHQCQKCQSNKNLVVHHLVPYHLSQNNHLDNLQALCRSCHGKVHTGELHTFQIHKLKEKAG